MPALIKFDYEPDDDLKRMLSGIQHVVEADSFAHQVLWEKYSDHPIAARYGSQDSRRVKWDSDTMGRGWTVGRLGKKPIFISLRTGTVNGVRVLFWYATSVVVHHDLISDWFDQALPGVKRTDANNFFEVINRGYNVHSI